jgi:hypothetical protein
MNPHVSPSSRAVLSVLQKFSGIVILATLFGTKASQLAHLTPFIEATDGKTFEAKRGWRYL